MLDAPEDPLYFIAHLTHQLIIPLRPTRQWLITAVFAPYTTTQSLASEQDFIALRTVALVSQYTTPCM